MTMLLQHHPTRLIVLMQQISLIYSFYEDTNLGHSETCQVYNDPIIKPFNSHLEIRARSDAMPAGYYTIVSNNYTRCQVTRQYGDNKMPLFDVVAEVGKPMSRNLRYVDFTPNFVYITFPESGYAFKMDKSNRLYVQKPQDAATTWNRHYNMPHFVHFGGDNANNYVNIDLEPVERPLRRQSNDNYLTLETGFGAKVGIHGYQHGQYRWGRIKVEMPTDRMAQICGLCSKRSYSNIVYESIEGRSVPAASKYDIQRYRVLPAGSTPINYPSRPYTKPNAVRRPHPIYPRTPKPRTSTWVAWSKQSWSGTVSTGTPTTRTRTRGAYNRSGPPGVRPKTRTSNWLDWSQQSWSGTGSGTNQRSRYETRGKPSPSYAAVNRNSGAVQWLRETPHKTVDVSDSVQSSPSSTIYQTFNFKDSVIPKDLNQWGSVVRFIRDLIGMPDKAQHDHYRLRKRQPNLPNLAKKLTVASKPVDTAGASETEEKIHREKSASTDLGLFNPLLGFDMNALLKSSSSANVDRSLRHILADPNQSKVNRAEVDINLGNGTMNSTINGRVTAAAVSDSCEFVREDGGIFQPCFALKDFDRTTQFVLCIELAEDFMLEQNVTLKQSVCHAYDTIRRNCLDMAVNEDPPIKLEQLKQCL